VRRTAVVLAALLLAAATGCSHHTKSSSDHATSSVGTAGDAAAAIPYGPGPQGAYTVAQQPPAGSCHYGSDGGQPLPDHNCTPGALNPKVTQATLKTTICGSGYTKGIRPPASITDREKHASAAAYGFTGSLRDAEYDHLVSLELGGDPNDPRNLWVEPPSPGHRAGSGVNNPKDQVENRLHTAVCSGQVTLSAAQQAIASDWANAERRLGLH
jgi:hypothetical protein